jgi:hypothetical protein
MAEGRSLRTIPPFTYYTAGTKPRLVAELREIYLDLPIIISADFIACTEETKHKYAAYD